MDPSIRNPCTLSPLNSLYIRSVAFFHFWSRDSEIGKISKLEAGHTNLNHVSGRDLNAFLSNRPLLDLLRSLYSGANIMPFSFNTTHRTCVAKVPK